MNTDNLTETIIGCAMKVSNTLGVGFLEKAAKISDEIHQAQLLNYLRATGLRVGLILNFGTPRLGIKRMVL